MYIESVNSVSKYIFIIGLTSDHTPLSLPNTLPGVWSSPQLKGKRPPPWDSFTFTKVDQDRAVLFGGEQPGHIKVNDLYLFNLREMVSWCCDMYMWMIS